MQTEGEGSAAEKIDDEKAKCKVCEFECIDGQEALGCDLCPQWFHRECINYNKATYKAIIQHEEVKWFCPECNKKTKDTLSMIQLVMQRLEVAECRNSATERKNAALEKRVLKLEKTLEERNTIQVPSQVSSITESQQRTAVEENSGNLTEMVSAELRELKEIEEKKSNIILTEIPEEGNVKEEEVQKMAALGVQNGDNTKTVIEKIFEKIGVKDGVEIREVVRIPQRTDGHQGNNPRKVLVKLANPRMQKTVLERAKEMKRVGNGWETTYISPDLTKKQREKAYQLRVEKRRRTDAGEADLIIRKGEIVVKQKKQSPLASTEARTSAT